MQKTINPIVKWAQRKDNIFLTVEVRDLKEEKVELTSTSLKFSAMAEGVNYAFEINFYAEVIVEESKWTNYGVNVRFILCKKDQAASYWTRLIKETHKLQYLQVDWNKYVDEDDEAEEGGKGLEDWNANNFQGFDGQGQPDEDEEDQEEQEEQEQTQEEQQQEQTQEEQGESQKGQEEVQNQ